MTTTTEDPLELIAAMRLEDGKRMGEVAADFQLDDLRAILHPGADGLRLHWLGRPKGGSKTTDLAAVAIAWLLTMAAALDEGFVIASDQDQARRLLTRAQGLITRTPGLAARLEVQSWAIVNRQNGARVIALAADAAGAEGTVSPLYLIDELPQWGDTRNARAMWDAAFSSIPKGSRLPGGMRFVVIGHAGIEGSWQHRLFTTLSKSLLWRVNDVPGPLPWIDPALLEDQRAVLTDGQFARRHLNLWSTGEDSLTTVDDLRRCVTLDGPLVPQPGVDYSIALDLGIKADRTVAVVAHLDAGGGPLDDQAGPAVEGERVRMVKAMESRGQLSAEEARLRLAEMGHGRSGDPRPVRVVLDRIEVWQGSRIRPVSLAEVEAWVLQAHGSFHGAPLTVDPWQAIGLAQRLRTAGVGVSEFVFSSSSVGRLASTLHRLLRDGALALPDDDDLLDELAHVRLVERTPGVVRLDHDAGRHDDRAMALAMVAHELLSRPRPVVRPATVTSYSMAATLSGSR